MLLFSTTLDIKENIKPEDFIKLVIKWNQSSPYKENVIAGLKWDNNLCLYEQKNDLLLMSNFYEKKNILRIRYENSSQDGVIWDTDYIINFNEHKVCIRLDRSFSLDALKVDSKFSTPYFIKHLIVDNYLVKDLDLDISYLPHVINGSNVELLAKLLKNEGEYRLPVVYVSKTDDNDEPLDSKRMAHKLKGVCHVLVEEHVAENEKILKVLGDKFESNGAVGIYYPGKAMGHRKIYLRNFDNDKEKLEEAIVRSIIQYSNAQSIDPLYTWQGVINEELCNAIDIETGKRVQEKIRREQDDKEINEIINEQDKKIAEKEAEIQILNLKLAEANKEKLFYESMYNKALVDGEIDRPVLYYSEEDEFFVGENKRIILEVLKDAYDSNLTQPTRRNDILKSVLEANRSEKKNDEIYEHLKVMFTGYKTLDKKSRRTLEDMGFEIEDEGKHYKMHYKGDSRYYVTFAKTASDGGCAGKNIASDIRKRFF